MTIAARTSRGLALAPRSKKDSDAVCDSRPCFASADDGQPVYLLRRATLLSDSVLHSRTIAQVLGMFIADAITRGIMATLVSSTVGGILGRPSRLRSDHCGSQTRATGSRKRSH